MDQSERERLRALCEMAPALPWEATMDEENGVLLVETVPRGDVPVACVEVVKHRGVQLMIDAVNALPALLDALDAADARVEKAEQERDGAVADASQWEALAEERKAALDGWRDDCARMGRERDDARAEVERLRASETGRREFTAAVLDSMRQIGREEEREACAAIAARFADGAAKPEARDVARAMLYAIRARGEGGAR